MPVKVLGVGQIKQALDALPERMQQNVLRAGNRAVANQLVKSVKQSGVPIAAAATSRPNPASKVTKGFLVGFRRPFSALAHLFEFGTQQRFHKSGKSTGAMRAQPSLRPALETLGKDQAEQIWAKAASRNLATQLKKLGLGR